jgi:orotidine-5'-phosphate decarboxylase
MSTKKLIVALDFSNTEEVFQIINFLNPEKCILKVGLQLYLAEGESILDLLTNKGFEIFLDLKLHDIPNTVNKAVEEIAQFNILMTTIHLQGGVEMIEAAKSAAGNTKILGVSLLTSLDETDISELYGNSFDDQFTKLITLAQSSSVDGIVCSPKELISLHDLNKIKVVPGIRNTKTSDDQKRTMTSQEAYVQGADYIVVGRPITQANNIEAAIEEYLV